MKTFFLLSGFLYGSVFQTLGQCTVAKDAHGQLITTCQVKYNTSESTMLHKQVTFLGSEYVSFPVWQEGSVRLDQSGREIVCLLAYNVVNQEVTCRFEDDKDVQRVVPYSFVLGGAEYIRHQTDVAGLKYTFYTTMINRGPTKLLKCVKGRFSKTPLRNEYDRHSPFSGSYQIDNQYYVQKENAAPQPVSLTKNSLLTVLVDQKEILESKLPKRELTPEQVIGTIRTYDSLWTAARLNSTTLATDPDFKEFLRTQINYPTQAWDAQVYARVYVGFDVSKEGQLVNIQLLSPDNVGFGFKQEIETALRKLPETKSAYQGRYALPITFTYTNAFDKRMKFVPINTLSDDLLAGRTLLNEFVVDQIQGKDVAKNREIWGYYK